MQVNIGKILIQLIVSTRWLYPLLDDYFVAVTI